MCDLQAVYAVYGGYAGCAVYAGYDGYAGYAVYAGYDGYAGYAGYAGCAVYADKTTKSFDSIQQLVKFHSACA